MKKQFKDTKVGKFLIGKKGLFKNCLKWMRWKWSKYLNGGKQI